MLSNYYPKETFYHKNLFPKNFRLIFTILIKIVQSQYCAKKNVQNKGMSNNLFFEKENLSMVRKDRYLKKLK